MKKNTIMSVFRVSSRRGILSPLPFHLSPSCAGPGARKKTAVLPEGKQRFLQKAWRERRKKESLLVAVQSPLAGSSNSKGLCAAFTGVNQLLQWRGLQGSLLPVRAPSALGSTVLERFRIRAISRAPHPLEICSNQFRDVRNLNVRLFSLCLHSVFKHGQAKRACNAYGLRP